MKIAELKKLEQELEKVKLSPETVASLSKLQEVYYRLGVVKTLSAYFVTAKEAKTSKEMKVVYLMFAKYVAALPVSMYFAPSDPKKLDAIASSSEKFLAVIAGVDDRAKRKYENFDDFFNAFRTDSVAVAVAFNELRDQFIPIK